MATDIDALWLAQALRQHYGARAWGVPTTFGPNGWMTRSAGGKRSLVVTCADYDGSVARGDLSPGDWVHCSLTGEAEVPTYDELKVLHEAVFRGGWAYQIFAPPEHHVNIHARALHLWGRLDGAPVLPDFTDGKRSI